MRRELSNQINRIRAKTTTFLRCTNDQCPTVRLTVGLEGYVQTHTLATQPAVKLKRKMKKQKNVTCHETFFCHLL